MKGVVLTMLLVVPGIAMANPVIGNPGCALWYGYPYGYPTDPRTGVGVNQVLKNINSSTERERFAKSWLQSLENSMNRSWQIQEEWIALQEKNLRFQREMEQLRVEKLKLQKEIEELKAKTAQLEKEKLELQLKLEELKKGKELEQSKD